MYKLIIIDDEYEHVNGIKNYIAWHKYDIEVCGVAYNGRDGLELIKELRPDIAIIDIQMPYISGLSLIQAVKDLGIHMQTIILSGYDYFEYAQKAIELKANNYLLKPCSAEEILQAVLRAKNLVIEEQNRKNIISQYHSLFSKYTDLLRVRLLCDLVSNKLKKPSTFFNESPNYNINLPEAACGVAVIRLEDKDDFYTRYTNEEFDFLLLHVIEGINNEKDSTCPFEVFVKDDDIVLISANESLEQDKFLELINKIFNYLQDNFEFPFVIGAGKIVPSPLQAHKSYNQALAALEAGLFLGNKKVTLFEEEMSEENLHYLYPFSEEARIFKTIETGDISKAKNAVNEFFGSFDEGQLANCHFIKKAGTMLLNNMMRFCAEKNIDSAEIQKIIFKTMDDIANSKTLEMMSNIITKLIEDIMHQIHKNTPVNKFIQKALDYIHSNYHKDISLREAADALYISPAYLSFLFKNEMKVNFIDYLNKYRVLMAKELLKDIRLKNYEIAFKVGFQDEKYFYKIFKKYTGLTASQYRDSLKALD
ncbi:MAG: response regulator [Clostridiaceae bacterium]|nr:response regulator [Clostridiaceae bacterium]